MNDLKELVLSVAPPDSAQPEDLSPFEIIASRQAFSLGDAIELVRWACQTIEEDPRRTWECVSLVAAISFRAPFRSSDTRRVLLLFEAREVSCGQKESTTEILEALRKEELYLRQEQRRAQRRAVVGSASQALDFLREFWGGEFVSEASEVLGYKTQTIRRWLDGRGISAEASGKLLLWARAFYGLPSGSEKLWWNSPLMCGKTPRQYFCDGWQDAPPGMLRVALQEIDNS